MFDFISKYKYKIFLSILILIYIVYFSYFSILRYQTLYASYYDLGIMHQTVYNTYQAIKERDFSRFLEMTDPESGRQIKRMAIHNDLILSFIALFYFIHSGPETLLVLQSVVLAFGAIAVFAIVRRLLGSIFNSLALIFAFCYLLYPPMQRANIFDFHAVTLSTSFLLFMFYFFLVKRYWLSFLFFILSLLTKEQVGLTTMMFGIYILINQKSKIKNQNLKFKIQNLKYTPFSLFLILLSIIWVGVSFLVIIPYFRGSEHFAVARYGDFGDTPLRIIIGIIKQPYSLVKYIFHIDTLRYFIFLLGPLAFLSLLSPIYLFVALPEFAINLLSNNWNMRNIIYHYTAVIQPWVFISAIYGVKKIINIKYQKSNIKYLHQLSKIIIFILIGFSIVFSYFKGPLPFAREQEIHPFKYPQAARKEVRLWAETLKDEKIKISATGQVAPHFSSRRYLYLFSPNYHLADYIVIRPDEVYNYPEKEILIPIYEKLIKDNRFERIYKSKNLEVFKNKSQTTNHKLQITKT